MDKYFTQDIDLEIKGKDGNVKSNKFQKHAPELYQPILLLKTENEFSLLCQSNHPLYILRDNYLIEIEASEVRLGDSIWVDNSICFNDNDYTPEIDPIEFAVDLKHNTVDNKFILGNQLHNLRFEPNFINYNKEWLMKFLFQLSWYDDYELNIQSIILVQQLKLMCDRVGLHFDFTLNNDSKNFDIFIDMDLNNKDFKKTDYDKIKSIQHIDYQEDFLYDLKTQTKEFMLSCVQNHNSFHCLKKESLVYVKIDNDYKVTSFEKLWDCYYKNNNIIINGDQEEKHITNLEVYDLDGFTKVNKIIRHKKDPNSKMVMIRNNNSDFIISQDNHPHMLETFDSNKDEMVIKLTKGKDIKKDVYFTVGNFNNIFTDSVNFDLNRYDNKTSNINKNGFDDNFIHIKKDQLKIVLDVIVNDLSRYSVFENCNYIRLGNLKFVQQLHILFNEFKVSHLIEYEDNTNYYIIYLNPKKEINKLFNDKKVDYYKQINFNEDEYVYDFETESHTLICNGIWTHNTGGVLELIKVDIIKEIMLNMDDKDEKILKQLLQQKERDLINNHDMAIIKIDKNVFVEEKIEEKKDKYILPLGYFTLSIATYNIPVTIEQKVEIYKSDDVNEDDNFITLIYNKNDLILHIIPTQLSAQDTAKHVDSLVGGKSPWTTPESLFYKFYYSLKGFDDWDTVHVETIVSNILRDRKDPKSPARLKHPYDPVTYSIKTLPSIISPTLGIAYENIGKSLSYAMIEERSEPSDIEKILFGDSVSKIDEKKKKRKK